MLDPPKYGMHAGNKVWMNHQDLGHGAYLIEERASPTARKIRYVLAYIQPADARLPERWRIIGSVSAPRHDGRCSLSLYTDHMRMNSVTSRDQGKLVELMLHTWKEFS